MKEYKYVIKTDKFLYLNDQKYIYDNTALT